MSSALASAGMDSGATSVKHVPSGWVEALCHFPGRPKRSAGGGEREVLAPGKCLIHCIPHTVGDHPARTHKRAIDVNTDQRNHPCRLWKFAKHHGERSSVSDLARVPA